MLGGAGTERSLVVAGGLWKNFLERSVFEAALKGYLGFVPPENRIKKSKAIAGIRKMKEGRGREERDK